MLKIPATALNAHETAALRHDQVSGRSDEMMKSICELFSEIVLKNDDRDTIRDEADAMRYLHAIRSLSVVRHRDGETIGVSLLQSAQFTEFRCGDEHSLKIDAIAFIGALNLNSDGSHDLHYNFVPLHELEQYFPF